MARIQGSRAIGVDLLAEIAKHVPDAYAKLFVDALPA
jgi:hypothetical protein